MTATADRSRRPSSPSRAAATRNGSQRRGRLVARLGLAAALIGTCTALAGCGAVDFVNEVGKPKLDVARVEEDIRSGLQRQIEDDSRTTADSVASVGRVRCRQRSETEATCIARVSRAGRNRKRRIAVSIDPRTGGYRWELAD